MSKTITFPAGTTERMQLLLKRAKTASEVKRVQCVLFGAQGVSSLVISPLVGFIPEYVREIWRKYRSEGEDALLGKRRGGRHNARLTFEEETKFLAPFFSQAKEAGILVVSTIQKEYEKRYKKVQSSVIYHLLHRHGWRKIVPRPAHPRGDKKTQEEFRRIFPPESKKSSKQSKAEKTPVSSSL